MSIKERKMQRLKEFSYSSDNFYFVTICCKDRIHFLGKIKENEMILNDFGKIVEFSWFDLPNHYSNCFLDEFVIMPNHIHGILIIDNNEPNKPGNNVERNGLEPFLNQPQCTEKNEKEIKNYYNKLFEKKINV
jgi:REP element-mobilizing transposase RayT